MMFLAELASKAGWVRATVYLLAMLYLFLGVNIVRPAWSFVAAPLVMQFCVKSVSFVTYTYGSVVKC